MNKLITSAVIAAMAITGIRAEAQTLAKDVKKEHKVERKETRGQAENMVSSRSKDSFYADFGKVADVKWVRGPQFDEATFTKDGLQQTAYYDNQFNLVGTTSSKQFADLPEHAQKEIRKQFAGYATGAVVEYKDNENNSTNMLLYGTQFDDADHYFVTVSKGREEDVLMVKTNGEVSFFRSLGKK